MPTYTQKRRVEILKMRFAIWMMVAGAFTITVTRWFGERMIHGTVAFTRLGVHLWVVVSVLGFIVMGVGLVKFFNSERRHHQLMMEQYGKSGEKI